MSKPALRRKYTQLLAATSPLWLPLPALGQSNPTIPAASPAGGTTAPQISVSNGGGDTPDSRVDPVDVTGVGQMFANQEMGGIGYCSGTLINPRTVLFAAHCVNMLDAWSYGGQQMGTAIAFAFRANNRPGLIDWFANGDYDYRTNPEHLLFNVNQVKYNATSLDYRNYLAADLAIGSLDTPATNIPTWTLLLSQLPAPAAIDGAAGTGYHVKITGYGYHGTGDDGATGLDHRRRVAENFIGMLGSLDVLERFEGTTPPGVPQNVYYIDFDDPRRGAAATGGQDTNRLKDDALPHEGITAAGDSGGPLILDRAFDLPTVIGVLSGARATEVSQAPASYGTMAFFQPLYLYWDWIVANNPYRYATARAGDGKWSDPNHWLTLIDPAYRVIDRAGNLVSGIPNALGAGPDGTAGAFGELCRGPANDRVCYDLANRKWTRNGAVFRVDQAGPGDAPLVPLPLATLANGLPGATGFVPNNVEPDRVRRIDARYFDVTLSAPGTTTLDTRAAIDRLTVTGDARLHVAATGQLTSVVDVTQFGGRIDVDGRLVTGGDYFLMAGLLGGSGSITTPYFTNLLGTIAPGGDGALGTLTFNGTVLLSSGSTLAVDLGPAGTSDRLVVKGNGAAGIASLSGEILFAPVAGYRARNGDRFTIVTADNRVEGSFTTLPLSAILTPRLDYGAKAVTMQIEAGNYGDVIAPGSAIQRAYAQILDQNRSADGRYAALYQPLDLASAEAIRSTLESLAPANVAAVQTLGTASLQTMSSFFADRLRDLEVSEIAGGFAALGTPVRAATRIAAGNSLAASERASLPDWLQGYAAGGYFEGNSRGAGAAQDNFHGWYAAAGIEARLDDRSAIGFALSYAKANAVAGFPGQSAKSALVQGTLYGKTERGSFYLAAQISAGALDTSAVRAGDFLGKPYRLRTEDTPLVLVGEAEIGAKAALWAVDVVPQIGMRTTRVEFSRTIETGGAMALQYARDPLSSVQGRAGFQIAGNGAFRPRVRAHYVHEFEDPRTGFGANLVGGIGPDAIFPLHAGDRNWAEIGGGVSYRSGAVELSLEAETSVGRDDLEAQVYRGAVTLQF